MWTRVELKERARSALHASYWQAFGVTTVVLLFSVAFTDACDSMNILSLFMPVPIVSQSLFWSLIPVELIVRVFLGNVMTVGMCHYFIKSRYGEKQFSNLFCGFGANYRNIVAVQFVTGMIVFLCTLALIVPGIIMSYKYAMVPYLLSENPDMNGAHARALSAKMTNGEKLNLFLLDLSFFGWQLLGLLCFTVGGIFVMPYYQATRAELYIVLRDRHDLNFSATQEEE